MEKKISRSQILMIVLAAVLLISVVINVVQFGHIHSMETLPIVGTYSVDIIGINNRYLVFDEEDNFYIYTQTMGISEEGKYEKYGENLYSLESITGSTGSVARTEKGVYCELGDEKLELFYHYSDTPIFIGDWEH